MTFNIQSPDVGMCHICQKFLNAFSESRAHKISGQSDRDKCGPNDAYDVQNKINSSLSGYLSKVLNLHLIEQGDAIKCKIMSHQIFERIQNIILTIA